MNSSWDLASQVSSAGFTMPWRLFTNEYWSPTSVRSQTHGIQYTSFINADSYFDLSLKIDTKDYVTGHGPKRDTTNTYIIFSR